MAWSTKEKKNNYATPYMKEWREKNRDKQREYMKVEEGFKEYINNERNSFASFINSFEWRTDLRTHVEDLLICFDQMRERLLDPQSPSCSTSDLEGLKGEDIKDCGGYEITAAGDLPCSTSAEEMIRQNIPTITFGKLIGTPIEQVIKVMDLYASSLLTQRDAEIRELKETVHKFHQDNSNFTTKNQQLQSQLDKANEEIEKYKVLAELARQVIANEQQGEMNDEVYESWYNLQQTLNQQL